MGLDEWKEKTFLLVWCLFSERSEVKKDVEEQGCEGSRLFPPQLLSLLGCLS